MGGGAPRAGGRTLGVVAVEVKWKTHVTHGRTSARGPAHAGGWRVEGARDFCRGKEWDDEMDSEVSGKLLDYVFCAVSRYLPILQRLLELLLLTLTRICSYRPR